LTAGRHYTTVVFSALTLSTRWQEGRTSAHNNPHLLSTKFLFWNKWRRKQGNRATQLHLLLLLLLSLLLQNL